MECKMHRIFVLLLIIILFTGMGFAQEKIPQGNASQVSEYIIKEYYDVYSGSYVDYTYAKGEVVLLKSMGFEAKIVTKQVKDRLMYRVQVGGSFTKLSEANALLKKLKANKMQGFIMKRKVKIKKTAEQIEQEKKALEEKKAEEIKPDKEKTTEPEVRKDVRRPKLTVYALKNEHLILTVITVTSTALGYHYWQRANDNHKKYQESTEVYDILFYWNEVEGDLRRKDAATGVALLSGAFAVYTWYYYYKNKSRLDQFSTDKSQETVFTFNPVDNTLNLYVRF